MARPKVKYKRLCQFDRIFRQLIDQKETFELRKTQYSKEIRINGVHIFFNDTGRNDLNSLGLIMKVRSDGKKFLDNPEWNNVNHIDFFNMINIPQQEDVLAKVDIKGAYWNYALMSGVVSPETDKYLQEHYQGHSYSYTKGVKLKSLGSLATRKKIIPYVNGKPDYDNERPLNQPTRQIYMNICSGIDEIMKKATRELEGCIYYYWDCIFLRKEFEKMAIEFFKDHKYKVGVGETRLEYVNVGDHGYLMTHDGNKPIMYMTKKEKRSRIKCSPQDIAYGSHDIAYSAQDLWTPDIMTKEMIMA